MNAGVELRLARVKRGLSREDLSSRTKITPLMLEAIEDLRVDRLPAPVYLRGFLRSYATEVGLAADVIVDRYLADRDSASDALTAFNSETTVLETVGALKPPVMVALDTFASETALGAAASALPEPDADETALPVPDGASIPNAIAVPRRAVTRRALGRIAALAACLLLVVGSVLLVRLLSSATEPLTRAGTPAAQAAMSPPDVIVARNVATSAVLHA